LTSLNVAGVGEAGLGAASEMDGDPPGLVFQAGARPAGDQRLQAVLDRLQRNARSHRVKAVGEAGG